VEVRRKSLEGNLCAVARSLDLIGDWWSLLIIRDALAGVRRFGEFQRSLGVAKNILSSRLKSLVAQGVLELTPDPEGGARQHYLPTEKGRALLPVIVALAQWGSEYLFEPGEPRSILVDAVSKRPLAKLQIRSEDGRVLRQDEVRVRRPEGMTTPDRKAKKKGAGS
jgi:DNA-binding HxlR family transcriptional regulator